jgi:uncharacterized protein YqhQ
MTQAANQPGTANEWQRARDTEGVVTITHIGGQALLEGIMMRGRYNWAIALRRPDGSIYTEQHELVSGQKRFAWMHWPIIRGCTALVESLTLGYQALQMAGENAMAEEDVDKTSDSDPEILMPEASDTFKRGEVKQKLALFNATGPRRLYAPPDAEVSAGAYTFSASGETTDDGLPSQAAKATAQHKQDEEDDEDDSIPPALMTVAMVLGIALGMLIFVALPAFLTNLIVGDIGEKTLVWNLVDGVLRICIFLVYIWLVSRLEEISRMFGYHGAEHRTIHCYEHGMQLTPENADLFPSLHVRCGTAFMLMTMIIAIVVFTAIPIASIITALGVTNRILRFLLLVSMRIVLIPLIAGLAYEVTVKWAGSRPENPLVRFVLWPGMQLQRLTTNKPDRGQLECAIAAMQLVLDREARE